MGPPEGRSRLGGQRMSFKGTHMGLGTVLRDSLQEHPKGPRARRSRIVILAETGL